MRINNVLQKKKATAQDIVRIANKDNQRCVLEHYTGKIQAVYGMILADVWTEIEAKIQTYNEWEESFSEILSDSKALIQEQSEDIKIYKTLKSDVIAEDSIYKDALDKYKLLAAVIEFPSVK